MIRLFLFFLLINPLFGDENYDVQKQQWLDKYASRYGEDVVNTILENKQIKSLISNKDALSKTERQNILRAIKRLHQLKTEEDLNETQMMERAKVLFPSSSDINHPKILASIVRGILAKNEEYFDKTIYDKIDAKLEDIETNGERRQADYESLITIIDTMDLKKASSELEASLMKSDDDDIDLATQKINKLNDFTDGLMMIKQVILYNELNLLKNEILSKLDEQFSDLAKAGQGKAVDLNFQIGVGIGDLVNIKASITPGCFITTGDDRSITEACKFSLKFISSIGSSAIAKFSASFEGSGSKERMFLGISQWVEHHIDSKAEAIAGAMLSGSVTGSKMLMEAQKKSKAADNLEEALISNQNLLLNFLIRHDLVEPGTEFKVRSKEKFVPIDVTKGSLKGQASITGVEESVVGSLAGASIDAEIKKSLFTRMISTLPYLLHDKEKNSDDILAAKQDAILFPAGSKCRIDAIKATYDDVKFRQTDADVKKRSANNLKLDLEYCFDALHKEVQSYAAVVNLHDKNRLSGSVKEKFEKSRKLRGRAHMLRSFIYTYAWLRKMYGELLKMEFKNKLDPIIANRFVEIEKDLVTPSFYIDKNDRKIVSKLQSSSADVNTFSFGLNLVGRPVEVRFTHVAKHPFPDNIGSSLDIKLPAEILFSKPLFNQLLAKITKHLGTQIDVADDERSLIAKMADSLKTLDITIDVGPLSVQQNTNFELSFLLVDKSFRLQYGRQIESFSIGGKVENVPVGLGLLEVGGGTEITKTKTLFEFIGVDTLGYARMIYNASRLGMRAGQDVLDNKVWTDFIKLHENELKIIAKNISIADSPVFEEALAMKQELSKVKKQANQMLENLEQDPTIDNLTEFFKLYYENVYLKKVAANWR